MRLRLASVALAAGCVLGSAQESEAFIRWIHELSGPGPFGGVTLKLDCDPGGTVPLAGQVAGRPGKAAEDTVRAELRLGRQHRGTWHGETAEF